MMRKIKTWLLSRTVTLSTICAALALVLLSTQVPQRGITSAETYQNWQESHQALLPVVRFLALDQIYSAPMFVALVVLALASLTISTVEQGKRAASRTFRSPAPEGDESFVGVGTDHVLKVLARHGYRPLGSDGHRYVKAPWGYWGNFILHLGITVTLAASLFIALTYQRSTITLYEGLRHQPESGWEGEEHGLLSQPLRFPYELRLDALRREFTPSGVTRRMASVLTLTDKTGRAEKLDVPLNAIVEREGVRIYQSISYGDLFVVEFIGPDGATHSVPLPLYQPNDLKDTSYRDFHFPWLPYALSTHYEADADKRSMDRGNVILAMRITENGLEAGKVYLHTGEEKDLGPYRVKLLGIGTWTSIFFVRIIGMPMVFFGFFILVAGMVLHYCTPPRELGVRPVRGGLGLTWKPTRFADFYSEELATIMTEMKGEKP